MGHLAKLASKYADRGFAVVGLTGEDLDTTLRYMTHVDPSFNFAVAISGGGSYPVPSIPYAYLIGPDGRVLWEGGTGSLSTREIERRLEDLPAPTAEVLEERAARHLAFARGLAKDGLVYRAHVEMERLRARYPRTKIAATALDEMPALRAARNAVEFEAQAALADLMGDPERIVFPRRPTSKRVRALAAKLEEFAEAHDDSAPRAAALASRWADLASEPWE